MGRKSSKKIVGHADLEAGETVVDAVYGLGKGVLRMADLAGGTRRFHYQGDAEARTDDPAGSSGARIDRAGIIVLTDRRLLFMPVKTAITKPKAVAAAFPLTDVLGASWEKNILAVEFADGSIGGLHVPRNEDPEEFVAAVEAAVSRS
ncbi:MAG: hypothetical protein U0W40_02165 [Acidimicrobiia bacterium]